MTLLSSAHLLTVPKGKLTPDEVLNLPSARFRSVRSERLLHHGVTDWWLRFKLRNDTTQACQRWLQVGPARLRNVRVYLYQGGHREVMRGGTGYPMSEWTLPGRQPVFPLSLKPHTSMTVLVRVAAHGEMMSLMPRLWDPGHFERMMVHSTLVDGLIYGSMLLLMLASLILAWIYRRPRLCYMALGAGFFTIYTASQANYFFVYLWPESPQLNIWVRYLFSGAYLAAVYLYLFDAFRIRRLGPVWSGLFGGIIVAFALLGLFGGLADNLSRVSLALISLDVAGRWLLLVVVVVGLWRGSMRHWFPLLLLGLLWAQYLHFYGCLLGLPFTPPGGNRMYMVSKLGGELLLLVTLINQVRLGRRAELRARSQLDRRRKTENTRLKSAVDQRTRELDHALQARRKLLARISHDLRSPLASILDSVHQWRAGDSRRDHPRLIERNVRQQMDMIDELLEFSHAELATLEPEPIPGYLYAFLGDVAEQAELSVERNGNRLQCDFSDNLPALVSLDYHYLQRVLANLLGNAGKFTQHGNIRFAVDAHPMDRDAWVRLHFIVDDDGPGIAPADRQRLLQPFARGADTALRDGHGLGLAIAVQLLECMGGRLQIDEAPGGGSRFHFELEAERATESDLEPVLEEGGMIDIDGAGRVILVVDDEPQRRDIACDLFDSYGYDSVAAADGKAALEILRSRRVGLVLTDQYMRGMDGWRLLQAVRREFPGIPVVLYSSIPPQPPAEFVGGPGFDAALLKPSSGITLVRLANSLMRQYASRPPRPTDGEPVHRPTRHVAAKAASPTRRMPALGDAKYAPKP